MFKSNQELLQATRDLTAALEKHGNASAARELRDGMAAINGLTDGWAAFLESVQRVKAIHSSELDAGQRSLLNAIDEAAYQAVYRRRARPWWKVW
jgi:hypothetical protein